MELYNIKRNSWEQGDRIQGTMWITSSESYSSITIRWGFVIQEYRDRKKTKVIVTKYNGEYDRKIEEIVLSEVKVCIKEYKEIGNEKISHHPTNIKNRAYTESR